MRLESFGARFRRRTSASPGARRSGLPAFARWERRCGPPRRRRAPSRRDRARKRRRHPCDRRLRRSARHAL